MLEVFGLLKAMMMKVPQEEVTHELLPVTFTRGWVQKNQAFLPRWGLRLGKRSQQSIVNMLPCYQAIQVCQCLYFPSYVLSNSGGEKEGRKRRRERAKKVGSKEGRKKGDGWKRKQADTGWLWLWVQGWMNEPCQEHKSVPVSFCVCLCLFLTMKY